MPSLRAHTAETDTMSKPLSRLQEQTNRLHEHINHSAQSTVQYPDSATVRGDLYGKAPVISKLPDTAGACFQTMVNAEMSLSRPKPNLAAILLHT